MLKKTKQEVVAEFRSSEILEAARRVFARKGFAAASVDEIAETAGLAKGTVYLYFPSKRDLYLAALQDGAAGLVEETRRNVDAAATTAEKIKAFLATRIRHAAAHRDLVTVCQHEEPCFNKELRSFCQRQTEVLRSVIESGAACGEIRALPADKTAILACEMTRALIGRRMSAGPRTSVEEDVEFLFNLIWKGLAASGDPARPGETPCTVG